MAAVARVRKADVIAAARDVLDEKGADGLTMAAVASRLGLTTMAVYRHVRDRADLVEQAVDLVLSELAGEPAPESGVGEAGGASFDGLERWMTDVRAQLVAHPWVGPALGTGTTLRPGWLAAIGRLARALERSPLDDAARARAVIWVTRVTLGIVMQEAKAPLPHAAADPAVLLDQAADHDRAVLAPIAHDLARVGNDDLFAAAVSQTRAYLESLTDA